MKYRLVSSSFLNHHATVVGTIALIRRRSAFERALLHKRNGGLKDTLHSHFPCKVGPSVIPAGAFGQSLPVESSPPATYYEDGRAWYGADTSAVDAIEEVSPPREGADELVSGVSESGPGAPAQDAWRIRTYGPLLASRLRLLARINAVANGSRAAAAPVRYSPAFPLPLVSCIMPTCGRPRFVAQAIAYFLRQDYPHRELVIAYERDEDLPPHAADSRIRYVRTPVRTSIGGKRNAAVAAARGGIVAQWDDDDWYGAMRLSLQVQPIVDGVADVTGMTDILFLQIDADQCWHAGPELHRRLFAENVCCGTLVYDRACWDLAGGYPAKSMREDADFMQSAMRGGARLCRISSQGAFVYIRHSANTWKFDEGSYLSAEGWRRVAHPDCMGSDLAFYSAYAAATGLTSSPKCGSMAVSMALSAPPILESGADMPVTPAQPMVSCIMPTSGRREFVPRAIAHFLRQDYANKELVIVDDGADSVAALVPEHPTIKYLRLPHKASIGTKRNHACMIATGSVIAHWDDDDWMASGWLTSQVHTLLESGADVCGLDKVYFHAPVEGMAWRYVYDGERPWVAGGTLCYTKECWRGSPFPDLQVGEDNAFIWSGAKQVAINSNSRSYVATVHAGNTSPKQTSGRRWTVHPVKDIEALVAL